MKRIAIIGAGLAGTAAAYVLKQRGLEPVIYEAGNEIAPGASGNEIGLYNPRLSAERSFHADAFDLAFDTFQALCHSERSAVRHVVEESQLEKRDPSTSLRYAQDDNSIDWNAWGSMHLITDEKKEKRFHEAVKNRGWKDMLMVDAKEASKIAGIEITKECLWLPRSGVVSPKKLCEAYTKGVEVHLNSEVRSLSEIKADAIIVANGMGAKNFNETQHLDLRAVRGQITFIEALPNIKCNLCYGGYATPGVNGTSAIGSTFQRWLDHSQIIDKDDGDNIAKLGAAIPALAGDYKVTGHRAAVRTTTPDHMPVYGRVSGTIYASTGHGSHGILTSLWAAHRIADDITGAA